MIQVHIHERIHLIANRQLHAMRVVVDDVTVLALKKAPEVTEALHITMDVHELIEAGEATLVIVEHMFAGE